MWPHVVAAGSAGRRPLLLCTTAWWVCVALLTLPAVATHSRTATSWSVQQDVSSSSFNSLASNSASSRRLLQSPGSCAPGTQLCGGKCVSTSSNPAACGGKCTRCKAPTPAGSGSAVCISGACSVSCKQGYERKGSTCRVCGKGFYKPAAGRGACSRCPDGTTTTGRTAADHDELRDCVPGGLIASSQQTGASLEKLLEFHSEWIRALNNTGGRGGGGKGGSGGGRSSAKACLYDCDGLNQSDEEIQASVHVAHLAGSPLTYSSNNPADVFAGVNLVGAVRDQRQCATCVSHAVVSAATSAAAVALGVDARQINMSPVFPYFCGHVFKPGLQQSCNSGWSFKDALQLAAEKPEVFFVNETCLKDVDILSTALYDGALLTPQCQAVVLSCSRTFKCASSPLLSDGIWQIQREIRRQGAVMTRILVDSAFRSFFQRNRTGVFNGTTDPSDAINHAVLLVGYNNEEFYWTALNSWGESWGDKGLFRIAYGVADVGHPEDTYALSDCFTTSNDPATVAGWSRPRPVAVDTSALVHGTLGCYLYTAVAKDSISGIADHFLVKILRLVQDNVARGVIPLKQSRSTGRQEPQLQPPSGSWEGTTFRVCGIPTFIFDRVATVTGLNPPPTQLDALLAVKAAIDPNDFVLKDWSRAGGATAGAYCKWQGITCDDAQNVTGIDIRQQSLGGVLPGSSVWLGLPSLSSLWLVNCSLGGALPARLHELPQLQIVVLSYNNISSTLPAEWGSWSHLRWLILWTNQIEGQLPPSWGANMTSLTNLGLGDNPLLAGSIPESWSGMTSLLELRMRFCALSGPLPALLPPNLVLLDLGGNKLSGSIGSGVTRLSKLRVLWLYANALTGFLPQSLADDLPALEMLDLSKNKLVGAVAMLAHATTLQALDLSGNMFNGPLPASESSWPAMRDLLLADCNFSGTIPDSWGKMANLTGLALWNNAGLTGCIPREFEGRVNQPGSGLDIGYITDGTGISGFCAASNGTR